MAYPCQPNYLVIDSITAVQDLIRDTTMGVPNERIRNMSTFITDREIVQDILDKGMFPLEAMAGWGNSLGNIAKQMLAEQIMAEKFGYDTFEDGDVIRFNYTFVEGGRKYFYAAIKAGGLWYTTGPKSPKAYTWNDLNRWWSEAYKVSKIRKVKFDKD